jgi:hypothetical protein
MPPISNFESRCKIGRFLVPRRGFVNGHLGVQSKQILLEPREHRGYLEPRFRVRMTIQLS